MRIFLAILTVLTLSGCVSQLTETFNPKPDNVGTIEESNAPKQVDQDSQEENIEEEPKKLPSTFDHEVDFASQAPLGNWDLPYQEACEEASMIMANYFFDGKELTPELMNDEILKLVEWEKENIGVYTDTNVEEVTGVAADYFGMKSRIIEDPTVDDIKRALVNGNVVIAPFAGRLLGNPNFTSPGPIYHMLLIRGYDRNEFITNDVGTRKGERYKYKYQTLLDAMHDLPDAEDGSVFRPFDDQTLADEAKAVKMLTGRSVVIVLSK